MKSRANLFFAIIVALIVSWPAAGQDKINFSKPVDGDSKPKEDANIAPETKRESHGAFGLPRSLFEPIRPTTPGGPVGAGPSAPPPRQSWNQSLQKKNQWTLQTPQEIMGILTPEKILGLPDKTGQDKLTPEERFTRRMEKQFSSLAPADELKPREADRQKNATETPGAFGHRTFESVFEPINAKNPNLPDTQKSKTDAAGSVKSLVNSVFAPQTKADSIWGNTFNFQQSDPRAQLPPQVGMDRYRQSQHYLTSEKTLDAARPANPFATRRDPYMEQLSPFNARGSTFAPLNREAERPHGLMPLPGIAARPSITQKKSPTAPELPPWLRDDSKKPTAGGFKKF